MERVNSNMYLENLCILQENERLRKKWQLLDQENKALLAELKLKQQHMASCSSTSSRSPDAAPGLYQTHVQGPSRCQVRPCAAPTGGGPTAAIHKAAAPSKSGKQQPK